MVQTAPSTLFSGVWEGEGVRGVWGESGKREKGDVGEGVVVG